MKKIEQGIKQKCGKNQLDQLPKKEGPAIDK